MCIRDSPRLDKTPGGTEWAGPELGAHTNEVLMQVLGRTDDEIRELRDTGVV